MIRCQRNASFTQRCHHATVQPNGLTTAYQPTTFLERGASVPFTAPSLAGARVRPAAAAGLELVLPNPAGGRGAYILPWPALRQACRPTVHDIQLMEQVAALRDVTPAAIRRVARLVASQGFAGRDASAAAKAALIADADTQIFTNFHLLLRLVQQEEPSGTSPIPPEEESPAELERRARRTIAAIAPRLRQDAASIATDLEALALLFDPIGLGTRVTRARLPHAIARLTLLRREVEGLAAKADDHTGALAGLVARTAALSLACAEKTLLESRAATDAMVVLLRDWRADCHDVSRRLTRTEWLLDGWDRICNLWWLDPTPSAQRNALDEIVRLLPVIPREAGSWVGFHVDMTGPIRLTRLVLGHEDWRTGLCVQDTIARNELLLAA